MPTSLGAVSVQIACAEPAGQCSMHTSADVVVASCVRSSVVVRSGAFSLSLGTCGPTPELAFALEGPFPRESRLQSVLLRCVMYTL